MQSLGNIIRIRYRFIDIVYHKMLFCNKNTEENELLLAIVNLAPIYTYEHLAGTLQYVEATTD